MESILVLKTALRHDTIRRAIKVTGRVSQADLKDRLGVTEMTILEDLKHLESKGLLKHDPSLELGGGSKASNDRNGGGSR